MVLGGEKKTSPEKEIFEVEHKHYQLPELYYTDVDNAWDEMEMLGFPLCSAFDLLTSPPAPLLKRGEIESLSLEERGWREVSCAKEFRDHLGKVISITGNFVTRKSTYTKKGDAMAFGTFLDRDGKWIDTTHFPNVIKQYPFVGKGCYRITGKVVEEFGFYSLDVTAMERLPYKLKYSTAAEV